VLLAEPPPHAAPEFTRRLLRLGIGIQAIWSVGHSPKSDARPGGVAELLVFADPRTLERLRKCDELQEAGVSVLVVTDGDSMEAAWGTKRLSASLSRWSWREVAPGEAYYDESRWAGDPASVVRVRRKAYLLWRRGSEVVDT
jgi:hypothetical protein